MNRREWLQERRGWWPDGTEPFGSLGHPVYEHLARAPASNSFHFVEADGGYIASSSDSAVRIAKKVFIPAWESWVDDKRPPDSDKLGMVGPSRIPGVIQLFRAIWEELPDWMTSLNPLAAALPEVGRAAMVGRRWIARVDPSSIDRRAVLALLSIRCFHCRYVTGLPEGPSVGLVTVYADRNHWLRNTSTLRIPHFELATHGFAIESCGWCGHPVGYGDGPWLWAKSVRNLQTGLDEVDS